MAVLPPESQARIKARAAGMLAEIEGLKALRQLINHSQVQIAESPGVKQPLALKIERQTDLYLSTLRRFVEAAGGTLELRIDLLGTGAFTLMGVGENEVGKPVGSGRDIAPRFHRTTQFWRTNSLRRSIDRLFCDQMILFCHGLCPHRYDCNLCAGDVLRRRQQHRSNQTAHHVRRNARTNRPAFPADDG